MPTKNYIGYLTLAVAVIVVVILSARTGATCGSEITGTPHVFVVSAFDTEHDALLDVVGDTETCKIGDVTYHVAEHAGEDVVLYMSGVGPKEARDSTTQTLANFEVVLLVFSGIAGAVDGTVSIGDTVVAREWQELSTGNTVAISKHLLTKAETMDNVYLVEFGVTTDHFVTDQSDIPEVATVVDMETYTVAALAHEHGIPFIAFRSVSDFADGAEQESGFEEAADASARVALEFVAQHE